MYLDFFLWLKYIIAFKQSKKNLIMMDEFFIYFTFYHNVLI